VENPIASASVVRHFPPRDTNPRATKEKTMPTYEYECQKCGHHFEARQSMKDPHLTDCPQESCEGPVKRKIGLGSGLIFKGSGFYITDYRSDSYKAAAKKESDGGGGGSSTASTPAAAPATGGSASTSSSGGGGSSSASTTAA
jgi:putative FmdB family regulatory protein